MALKHSALGFGNFKRSAFAFTLAELLIALSILGVIATFTIPKVLNAQQDGRYNATAREMIGMIGEAYSAYRLNNTPTAGTTAGAMTPFFNYVKIDTTSGYDGWNSGSGNCGEGGGTVCLSMHNGGNLVYESTCTFGGTGTLNATYYRYDHDRKISGQNSLGIVLYYNGRITTRSGIFANTSACGLTFSPGPDPSWFNWN